MKLLEPNYYNEIFTDGTNLEFTDLFIEKFLNDGIVLLRDYDCSLDEQRKITLLFRDTFPKLYYPENEIFNYNENHEYTFNKYFSELNRTAKNDDLFVTWHMEMIGFPNPATGATWNMVKFECSEESGKTYFYNACDLFEKLSLEEINILKSTKFIANTYDDNKDFEDQFLSPIIKHPLIDKDMVYIYPGKCTFVCEKNNEKDIEAAYSIHNKLATIILRDEEKRIYHKWKKSDMIFVDLLRMYHAVTGGFVPEQRFFHGFWIHSKLGTKYGKL